MLAPTRRCCNETWINAPARVRHTGAWNPRRRRISPADPADDVDVALECYRSRRLDNMDAATGTDIQRARHGSRRERAVYGGYRIGTRSAEGVQRDARGRRSAGDPDFGRGVRRAADDARIQQLPLEAAVQM